MKNAEMAAQLETLLYKLDSTTLNHSIRVLMIAIEIEEYLRRTSHQLMCAALFHDLGKLYVPFNILDKNCRLTNLEREIVDLHPYIGYTMLSDVGVNEDICRTVLYHHGFRMNTLRDLGYYDKNSIYEDSLILHTIDAFEALTSDRPYHRSISAKEALEILKREGKFEIKTLNYIESIIEKGADKGSAVVKVNPIHFEREFVQKMIAGMDLL